MKKLLTFSFLLLPVYLSANEGDLQGLAKLKPLFDYWMRDTYVNYVKETDSYYMTGTTADPSRDFPGDKHARDFNDGIYVWQSKDLKNWESLGRVWSFEKDATWHNEFVLSAQEKRNMTGFEGMEDKRRSVWAPEIHYVNDNFYIVGCMNWHPSEDAEENGKVFLLESTTGKPEGPYRDPVGKPLGNRIDPSLFEDDDGSVYFVWQEGRIAKMKPDMSGFAEEPRQVDEEIFPDEPYVEGVYITKRDGLYYLIQAIWWKEKPNGDQGYFRNGTKLYYDCMVSTSKNVYGPYGKKYTAIRGAGHNNLFQDRDGNWWATYFGNPVGSMRPSFMARPAIIPLKFDEDGKFSAYWEKVGK
jgi:beta-xylosidase